MGTKNCVGKAVPITLDGLQIKRFYTKGARVEWDCPECGKRHRDELDGDCINYPDLSKPYEYGRYCSDCEFKGEMLLHFSLAVRAEIPKED